MRWSDRFLPHRMSRYDWFVIIGYWAIACPATYFANATNDDPNTGWQMFLGFLFTIPADTITVVILVFGIPSALLRRKYLTAFFLILAVLVFGLLFMICYHSLQYGYFNINVKTWIAGILQHLRSYGLLFAIIFTRKVLAILRALVRALAEKEKEEAQKLRSRISPHFLLNSLQVMESLIKKEGRSMYLSVTELLYYFTYECDKEYILLQRELEVLKSIIHLAGAQLPHPENIEVQIAGSADNLKIVPGILAQFMENIFKHCGREISDFVRIDITILSDTLYYISENTYLRKADNDRKGGVGLEYVHRMLDIQYGRGKYELDIRADDGIYTVNLSIPLL